MGGMSFTAANTVTISDTETNLVALTHTQLTAMVAKHVDIIDATGGTLVVSTDQVSALPSTATHLLAADGDTVHPGR